MATRTMRSKSPVTLITMKKYREMSGHGCEYSMINKNEQVTKIDRIVINSKIEVEVLNIVSPSCIWVRQLTHIANEMDLVAPYPIRKSFKNREPNNNDIKNYYMAPRTDPTRSNQIVYSRCRLLSLKHENGSVFAYVFYIDYAYGEWLNVDSLGDIPAALQSFLWQAIPIALLSIPSNQGRKWTPRECSILESILSQNKTYLAKPVPVILRNIDKQYARVNLEAIPSQRSVAYDFYNQALASGEMIALKNSFDELTSKTVFELDNAIPKKPANISAAFMRFPNDENLRKPEEEIKIHRILLNSEVEVEFLSLVSPSCIWVRQLTHVANEMDLFSPYPIKKALKYKKEKPCYNSINIDYYYMAPRTHPMLTGADEIVYSRSRLLSLKHENGSVFGYVFYIDHGYGEWVNVESLGDMPFKLQSIPWQAIPIALLGVSPLKGFDKKRKKWTSRECSILESILKRHKLYLVKPVICKLKSISNYGQYARVHLEAIDNSDQEESSEEAVESTERGMDLKSSQRSVAYDFYSEALASGEKVVLENSLDELTAQDLFKIDNEIPEKPAKISVEFMKFPKNEDLRKTEEELEEEKKMSEEYSFSIDQDAQEIARLREAKEDEDLKKWDSRIEHLETYTHQIPNFDTELNLEGGEELRLILNVTCSKSPHDFYGYIFKNDSPTDNSFEAAFKSMLETHDELDKWQEVLDNFYLNAANCKPLKSQKIHSAFWQGRDKGDVYAIFRISDKLEQTHFVRIKIVDFVGLNYENSDMMSCSVQLLDRGGIIHGVNSNTLLRLHSTHAKKPAQAVNFCLSTIVPFEFKENMRPLKKNEEIWSLSQLEQFYMLILTDAPMRCKFKKIDDKNAIYEGMPNSRYSNVCYIEKLRPISQFKENTVEQLMVKKNNVVVCDLFKARIN